MKRWFRMFLMAALLFAGICLAPQAVMAEPGASAEEPIIGQKDGWIRRSDGRWEYQKEDGTLAKSEWLLYDGSLYYFKPDGIMYSDEWYQNPEGKKYRFASWGGMLSDQWFSQNGNWYYLNENGTMKVSEWFLYDGSKYCVDDQGVMRTGWYKENGFWYYFESWGGMRTEGWLKYDGNWYYLNEDGTMKASEWFEYDGSTYCVQSWGGMRTGWYTEEGKIYYFENWGGLLKEDWIRKESDWYYAGSDGAMITEDWLLYDGNWYWLGEDGIMYHDSWLYYDDVWYYLKSWGGACASEWKRIDGEDYYFRSWGGMVADTWYEIDGKWYYFYSWGGLAKDTYIDGYYVDSNGVRHDSKSICVAIDAGHQLKGNNEQEPIGPGASETKAKVSSGTCGVSTGINEYELNLAVSLKVRDILKERGYEVYMIRETNDVNISNKERAELASENGADILVRIHANGDSDSSIYGALTMAPGNDNPYLTSDVIAKSRTLSEKMIDSFCAATGAKNRGVLYTNSMSGINWSTIPVTIVEMGFMSNPSEDEKMATEAYRDKMAKGIADGIDAYYAS
ncbi:MAG: N-acetylmuramoyl-L-alanine amidase [Fusicatenibacter sp.]|nr:N-acetylmuramoyl-L-alanine amidase [Fusicatenibacter sp.]